MIDSFLFNKKVLVAEDNAINQMVVKHTLLKLGAIADIAGDGIEVVEKVSNNKYDLILMDIQMPLMDGYETTAYIRNQLNNAIPIIAMTAFAFNGEDEKCLKCGMNGYVSKPFTMDSLNKEIEKILSLPTGINSNPHILCTRNVVVDVSMLYDITGNDKTNIHTMVQTFRENMPKTIFKIEESLKIQDWDNVYLSAHHAKSSLSIIKINEVFEWVINVENNAKNKTNLDTLPELVKKIKEKFVVAEQMLGEKFGEKYSFF